ncbi:BFH_collapsed_G0021140.mRNA.1.CDS.1 [Saccharomyces cerevisiae]|nr:BFH_collapsed_G0021140.mRNA.1.CDS.1 [Saccharomyces cerevisiae]
MQTPVKQLDTVQKHDISGSILSKNTKIREKVRSDFSKYYLADVVLTAKGKKEIQKGTPYEDIEKLQPTELQSNTVEIKKSLLKIVEAQIDEPAQYVKKNMSSQAQYIEHLFQIALETTNTSDIAIEWNNFRKLA